MDGRYYMCIYKYLRSTEALDILGTSHRDICEPNDPTAGSEKLDF